MSHTAPKSLSDYRKDIDSALEDSFLRRTLDTFAVAYRANREAVFKEVDERGLIKQIADAKDDACKHMEELYEQFRRVAEERGVHVHRAATAEDANRIIASIARENNVKRIIKSKSMTAEEIQLNPYLEKEGFIVDETDLGEWIIQLRHEGPSHMVMPAIHLSRYQVADDFTKETGVKQDAEDIQRLVKVARVQLRRKFINGDMGISGCNFAVAEMGAVSTVTNEGNARMVTTLPRVHVAIAGLDKLIRASYHLLGLMSFLTSGEDETRAWTIKQGTKAPQAAGKIHTDFERGFIKAEVVNYKDLLENGSLAAAREKGLVRMEGKEYVVQDGDVILFRFNV